MILTIETYREIWYTYDDVGILMEKVTRSLLF